MNPYTSQRAAIALFFVAAFAVVRLVLIEQPVGPVIRGNAGWYAADFRLHSSGVHQLVNDDWKGPLHRWRLWAAALNDGARLALVGGTTIVFASAPSEPAIIEGVNAGRVYVRLRDRDTPTIEFTAQLCGRVYRLGDTIPIQPFTTILLEAILTGAQGQLHWIRAGEPVETVEISGSEMVRTTTQARPGDWFSIVIVDDAGPTLLTSAIYTEER